MLSLNTETKLFLYSAYQDLCDNTEYKIIGMFWNSYSVLWYFLI